MIDWLEEHTTPHFPSTAKALEDPSGLLAAGGGISPEWLHAAYRRGIFPWHDEDSPRLWWTPVPRAVILPEHFSVPRSLKKEIRKTRFRFTSNLAFAAVITSCARVHGDDGGTWIQPEMISSYTRMAKAGMALSVEVWNEDGRLVGGFYGILLGSAYFGESMFSSVGGASKQAFALAAELMFKNGVQMIDCQMKTDHLARFGLCELGRREFEQRLAKAVSTPLVRIPLPTAISHQRPA